MPLYFTQRCVANRISPVSVSLFLDRPVVADGAAASLVEDRGCAHPGCLFVKCENAFLFSQGFATNRIGFGVFGLDVVCERQRAGLPDRQPESGRSWRGWAVSFGVDQQIRGSRGSCFSRMSLVHAPSDGMKGGPAGGAPPKKLCDSIRPRRHVVAETTRRNHGDLVSAVAMPWTPASQLVC